MKAQAPKSHLVTKPLGQSVAGVVLAARLRPLCFHVSTVDGRWGRSCTCSSRAGCAKNCKPTAEGLSSTSFRRIRAHVCFGIILALPQDALSSGRYGLPPRLASGWNERHNIIFHDSVRPIPARPPDGPQPPSVCCQLQFCVCGRDDGQLQAFRFHKKLVALLKPSVVAARPPRAKKGVAADQKQEPPKKPPKTPQRKLLEEGFLVLKLEPVVLRDGGDIGDVSAAMPMGSAGSWAQALCQSHPEGGKISSSVWIHLSYVNFRTWAWSGVRFSHGLDVFDHGRPVIRLEMPQELIVQNSLEFLASLDLNLAWVASWHVILSDATPVARQEFSASRNVFVAAMQEPRIPDFIAWRGKLEEDRIAAQAAKRQASSGSGRQRGQRGPVQRGPRPAPRDDGFSQEGPGSFAEDELGTDVPPSSENPVHPDFVGDDEDGDDASEDDLSQLLEEMIDAANSVADHQQPESDAPDDNKPGWTARPPRPSSGPGPGPEASSSSAGRSAAAHPGPVPKAPAAAAPPMQPEARAKAAVRKKLTTESVLPVPPYGSIHYNPRSKVFIAHCKKHGLGVCKKQRTVIDDGPEKKKGSRRVRPLGFLMAWLEEQGDFDSKNHHVFNSHIHMDKPKRASARQRLKAVEGAREFFVHEAGKGPGSDSEPDLV